jgi:hypothetical protein
MSRDELIALVGVQVEQIAVLRVMNDDLAAKLAKVEHLLSRNSGNSSMPPSTDDDPGRTPPAVKPKRQAGGPKRSRGKQPGAPGANLAWVGRPDDQVDRFPRGRCECGHDLAEATDLGVVDRYQQHEIPRISVSITQYDQHQVRCGCGRIHTAQRPDGARTGLASVVTGALFLVATFFTPLVQVVPSEAAAPALVIVGALMISQIRHLEWDDMSLVIPAFLTIVLMPFTYSITNGIGAGVISYVLLRSAVGRARDVHPLMWVISVLFLVYFALEPLQQLF